MPQDKLHPDHLLALKVAVIKEASEKLLLEDRVLQAGRRRVDPEARRRGRRLSLKSRGKRKRKSRKKKPIRKEDGRLILDVSPMAFRKHRDSAKTTRNPLSGNRVKIKSLANNKDTRAYNVFRRFYLKWKNEWKNKFEAIKARQKQKEQARAKRASEREELRFRDALIRIAYQSPPKVRRDLLSLFDEV